MAFRPLLRAELLPEGAVRTCPWSDRFIALARVNGTVYAMDDECPHQGALLSGGSLCGAVLACPRHGWQFDVRTGESVVNPEVKQPTHSTRESDGMIEVDL